MASEDVPNFGTEEFEVASDKPQTRSGSYIVLALALVAGGGYLFMKHGPSSASAAAPSAVGAPNEAQKSITEFLSMGGKDITDMQKNLHNTELLVKQFNAYASMTQVPLTDLKSNPFRSDVPRKADLPPTITTAALPPGMSAEELARKATEESKIRSQEAASKLRIDSIMVGRGGTGGSAMINGEVVKVGGKIGGFVVDSIKPGVVVVRDGTLRFERRMGQ